MRFGKWAFCSGVFGETLLVQSLSELGTLAGKRSHRDLSCLALNGQNGKTELIGCSPLPSGNRRDF